MHLVWKNCTLLQVAKELDDAGFSEAEMKFVTGFSIKW
jgi:hypothetical protein